MIPAGVEERLRAHVFRVLAHAHVPAADRGDVAEELYGHLVERWQALIDDGMEPMRAADEAVRLFGGAERIGADLTRSFRGRFWASTIGVLLPAVTMKGPRPTIAWWLGASLWSYGVLGGAIGVGVAAQLSPVRAAVVLLFAIGTAVVYVVAAAALARRQRWGLDIAVAANVIGLVTGTATMMNTAGLISLNVVLSGLLLAFAYAERRDLGRWVRRSRSVEGALAVAILATVLGGAILPAAAAEIPDPTQAGPGDLQITTSVSCGNTTAIVSVELRWDRVALLPGGVANLSQYGDMLLLETSADDAWVLDNLPALEDKASGTVAAQSDVGYRPNGSRVETLETAPHAIQINWNALEPGRTYRATWELRRLSAPGVDTTFAASVEYLHADQFRWEQLVDCMGGRHEPIVSDWP